jgi:hypothetical protein
MLGRWGAPPRASGRMTLAMKVANIGRFTLSISAKEYLGKLREFIYSDD